MPLSKNQVKQIARLARLKLTSEEIEPRNQFITVENVFREDRVRSSLPRDMALRNAPDSDGEYFRVPRVIR